MTNRSHAHSKRRRSAPPRSFSASTGLTGATEAELAHRTAITEAAMAAAEKSARRAARAHRFTASAAPRTTRPAVPRTPRPTPSGDPPRSFARPPEPSPPARVPTAARPEAAAAPRSRARSESREGPERGEVGSRSPRSLVTRLVAAVAASEAVASKVVTAARSAAPVRAPRADGTDTATSERPATPHPRSPRHRGRRAPPRAGAGGGSGPTRLRLPGRPPRDPLTGPEPMGRGRMTPGPAV